MMNDSTLKKAYCIANSGYCDLKTKIKCYDLGMDFFIIKPLNQNLLKEILLCFFPTLENSLTT
jgi:response regulator RpfG family c-di-GMP phosphodiesterase